MQTKVPAIDLATLEKIAAERIADDRRQRRQAEEQRAEAQRKRRLGDWMELLGAVAVDVGPELMASVQGAAPADWLQPLSGERRTYHALEFCLPDHCPVAAAYRLVAGHWQREPFARWQESWDWKVVCYQLVGCKVVTGTNPDGHLYSNDLGEALALAREAEQVRLKLVAEAEKQRAAIDQYETERSRRHQQTPSVGEQLLEALAAYIQAITPER